MGMIDWLLRNDHTGGFAFGAATIAGLLVVVLAAIIVVSSIINCSGTSKPEVCYTIVAQGQTYELKDTPKLGTLANGMPVIQFENGGEKIFITGGVLIKYNKDCEENDYALSD